MVNSIIQDLNRFGNNKLTIFNFGWRILLHRGLQAIMFYRLNNFLWVKGFRNLSRLLMNLNTFITGAEIHPAALIKGGLKIHHTSGVVIGYGTILEENVTIFSDVVFGEKGGKKDTGNYPKVESNSIVYSGAKIVGDIIVGNNSIIGANSVLTKSVPPFSLVFGNPSIIKEGYYS
ncbi:serine O-acetyltransferase [Neobacillus niacini]|uniref:serine O-acetyltransferase n=1 Tax=Neobacillus niacini TaxID=86668 RepID=UPI003B013DBD